MANQNLNITYQWCFFTNICDCIDQEFQFFSTLFPFYKGSNFIKHCIVATSNNSYATDRHFIESYILKRITKYVNTRILLWVKKEKNNFEFKRQKLLENATLNYIAILKLYFWNTLEHIHVLTIYTSNIITYP